MDNTSTGLTFPLENGRFIAFETLVRISSLYIKKKQKNVFLSLLFKKKKSENARHYLWDKYGIYKQWSLQL